MAGGSGKLLPPRARILPEKITTFASHFELTEMIDKNLHHFQTNLRLMICCYKEKKMDGLITGKDVPSKNISLDFI